MTATSRKHQVLGDQGVGQHACERDPVFDPFFAGHFHNLGPHWPVADEQETQVLLAGHVCRGRDQLGQPVPGEKLPRQYPRSVRDPSPRRVRDLRQLRRQGAETSLRNRIRQDQDV